MNIKSKFIAPVILIFFIAGIAGSMMLNFWNTESDKTPAKIQSGEFEGMNDPGDIRGSYSFLDISNNFNIPVEILGKAFGVTGKTTEELEAFKCKEFETIYSDLIKEGEIGTDSVKLFVALYNKLPHTPEETTLLPLTALPILEEKLGKQEIEKIKDIFVDTSNIKVSETIKVSTESHETAENRTIKGQTTFKNLLDWGLTKEEIENSLGMPMGKTGESVRDFCSEKGIEFSPIKEALQTIVDKKK